MVAEDSGLSVEFRRCGTIEVATDEATVAALRGRSADTAGAEWLSRAQLADLEPGLSDTCGGGLLVRDHGYVAAAAFTEALAWGAMRHGAQIETHRRIAQVLPSAAGVRVVAEDGTGWSAGRVVLAAGSWAKLAGLAEAATTRVHPIRGQLLRLAWAGPSLGRIVWGERCYVVPWKDGTVLVGATVEDVGFDERTTAAGVRDLLDAVCELLPQAWTATFVDARVGLRPATTDGLPLLGPSAAAPNVVYATGHYRNGVLLAPITATLLADSILDERADPALAAFSPARFQR
jgi:glycine oxidase